MHTRPLASLRRAFLCASLFTISDHAFALAQIAHAPDAPTMRLTGEWLVHYEKLMRNMHESEPHVVNETAKLSLRVRGDSVFGYWQYAFEPGETPPEPSSVRGIVKGDSVHVQIDPPPPDGFWSGVGQEIVEFLKTYVHNMPPMTTHLDFVARGDSLLGTRRAISADGSHVVLPRPLVGARTQR